MKVFLKFTLECEPDAAWNALRRPSWMMRVSSPIMRVLPAGRLPQQWVEDNPVTIRLRSGGIVPVGSQLVDVHYRTRPDGVRIIIDSGRPMSGPLRVVRTWEHRMAVSPGLEPGTTLYRDRLTIKAGLLTFPVWLSLWALWQYRGMRIRRFAKNWN